MITDSKLQKILNRCVINVREAKLYARNSSNRTHRSLASGERRKKTKSLLSIILLKTTINHKHHHQKPTCANSIAQC